MALFGEDEWYFFSPRERKYPQGVRPNRMTPSGYWKATGIDQPIFNSTGLKISIGVKKVLVFYINGTSSSSKRVKTDWIMTEYRLLHTMIKPSRLKKEFMRLDDWVLCRVRKRGIITRRKCEVHDQENHGGSRVNTDMIVINSSKAVMETSSDESNLKPYSNNTSTTSTKYEYLYKNCPVLASILSDQGQGEGLIDIIKSSNETGSRKVKDSAIKLSFLDNYVNQMKSKSTEEDEENEEEEEDDLFRCFMNTNNIESCQSSNMQMINSNIIDPIVYFLGA